jgi:hypothetical protein
MPMTVADRVHQMPHGAQRVVARDLGLAESYVSAVITGDARPKTARGRKTVRRVQVAIARKLSVTVDEAFPPDAQQETAPPLAHAS